MSKKSFHFTWRIENISSCYQRYGEFIESPYFTADSLGGSVWYLRFYPRGRDELCKEYASLFLCKDNNEGLRHLNEICVNLKVEMSAHGREAFVSSETKCDFREYINYGWPKLVSLTTLKDALNNAGGDKLVISFRLTKHEPIVTLATGCEATTKIAVNRCFFHWNIEKNFTSTWTETKISPFLEICPIEMTLTLPDDDLLVRIHLIREYADFTRSVTCKMVLLDVDGIEHDSKTGTCILKYISDTWEFPSFIKKSYLAENEIKLLKDGYFTLACHFTVSSGTKSSEIDKYVSSFPIKEDSSEYMDNVVELQEHYLNMLVNRKYSDMNLLVGGKTIPVHKSVLANRSPVFLAMFERDMLESKTGAVDITDSDVETMQEFVEFLYTAKVAKMDYDRAARLIVVSDKYQVLSLKEKCASYLMSILSLDNVCDILEISDLLGHKLLKDFATTFVKDHSREVLISEKWREFLEKNCKLGSDILWKLSGDFIN